MKTIGLVISGGGSRGQFGAEILNYLKQRKDLRFPQIRYISGVSVGSIIGAMVAQGDEDKLMPVFSSLKNSDIYKGKISFFKSLLNRILGKNYVSDIEPLYHFLNKYISLEKAKNGGKEFYIGTMNMTTGKYQSFKMSEIESQEDYIRLIVASCSQPVIWKPQSVKEDKYLSDGGVGTVSPIGDIIEYCDHLYIINNSPITPSISGNLDKLEQVLLRTIDISIATSFKNDIDRFLTINKLVKEAIDQKPDVKLSKKYVNFDLFQTSLHDDSMNFEDRNLFSDRCKNAYESYMAWKNKTLSELYLTSN